jgi:DNA invertase Pin-like site-specific DNA recombinase
VHTDIGVSGGAKLDKRPGLMAALDALAPGLALVAIKRDRLARETMNVCMIERLAERKGACVLTCAGEGEGNSPEAVLMRTMVDAFAQYERQIIGARTKTAMGHKRTKGERISRHIPYGKTLLDDNLHLVDNPDELAIITIARELHVSGLSSRKIAAHLAARGLYNRAGQVFSPGAVLNMVAA